MDITAFVPVLHSYVVAGDMGSQLALLRLPESFLDRRHEYGRETGNSPQPHISPQPEPVPLEVARALGKVSRAPVADVAVADTTAAAASGRAVATWDLVGGARVRHLDAPQAVARCVYVAPQLVAAVGDDCAVHLWDVRAVAAAPAVSVKVARDNLYAVAVREGRVFCGGADGAVYTVDLRAQRAHRWSVPGGRGAVLDLAAVGQGVVAIMEAGAVVGVPETGRALSFVAQVPPFSHRAVGDVVESDGGLRVAVGGDDGRVHVVEGGGGAWRRHEWRAAAAGTRVPVVRWADALAAVMYACAGGRVVARTA